MITSFISHHNRSNIRGKWALQNALDSKYFAVDFTGAVPRRMKKSTQTTMVLAAIAAAVLLSSTSALAAEGG